jgi:hypothetical protein
MGVTEIIATLLAYTEYIGNGIKRDARPTDGGYSADLLPPQSRMFEETYR